MRRRTASTAIGKRLKKRVSRIAPKKERGLTEGQIRYRKRKKKVEDYWKHESTLQRRYRPR